MPPGVGGGAAPIVNTAPAAGSAAGGANGEGVEAEALPAPKAKPLVPFCPGSPAGVAAGDAGWLPNANELDGAVALVGVGTLKLKPPPLG